MFDFCGISRTDSGSTVTPLISEIVSMWVWALSSQLFQSETLLSSPFSLVS